MPDTDDLIRDEVGLVRVIAVKVRGSYFFPSAIRSNEVVARSDHPRNGKTYS
jgi:hypothetical protein